MMRKLLLSLCLAAAAVCSADAPSDYATGIALELPGKEAFYRVELPLAVHAGARADLADLRIFNAHGETVPYALGAWRDADGTAVKPTLLVVPRFPLKAGSDNGLPALDVKIEQNTNGKVIAIRSGNAAGVTSDSAKTIAYLFDVSAIKQAVQAVVVDWPASAKGYSVQGHLEASDDLKTWQPLAAAPLLEMRFAGQQLMQKRLAFPAGHYHYLRLVANEALPEFSLTQVEALAAATPPAPPRRWHEVTATPGEKPGDYVFDLGAPLALTGLCLQLPQINTVAPIELRVRDHRNAAWQHVTSTVVYRLERDGKEIASPMLELSPQSGRYWLLHVDPRAGGIGAGLPTLKAGWTPRQLIFVARGRGPFTLAFGNRDAPATHLPLASLLPGYKTGAETALPAARLLAAASLGGKNAANPDHPATDWKKRALWGVLGLGVLLLAGMAWGLMRQMQP